MSSGKFVFISIAVLVLLSGAGCIDSEAQNAPVNTPAPVSTETVTATATLEPTPAPTETHWWDEKRYYEEAKVQTLFNTDIEGIKAPMSQPGNYNLFENDAPNLILKHFEYTLSNLDLAQRLQPEQYNALDDKYGHMESVTMEQIDDDRDGTFDRVAVKYVGDEGSFTYEQENVDGNVQWYLERFINDDWDELKPQFKEAGII